MLIFKFLMKRPLGRLRYRWVDNIEMDLVEKMWSFVDCIGLAEDRYKWKNLVKAVMNLRLPQNSGKLSIGCTTRGLSSSAQHCRVS
jgi:hypothetical protein